MQGLYVFEFSFHRFFFRVYRNVELPKKTGDGDKAKPKRRITDGLCL